MNEHIISSRLYDVRSFNRDIDSSTYEDGRMIAEQVLINGIEYEPKHKKPSCKYPSDRCPNCFCIDYVTTDSRGKDGYRYRRKKCLECGKSWNTIEYAYKPKGRPKKEHMEWEDDE